MRTTYRVVCPAMAERLPVISIFWWTCCLCGFCRPGIGMLASGWSRRQLCMCAISLLRLVVPMDLIAIAVKLTSNGPDSIGLTAWGAGIASSEYRNSAACEQIHPRRQRSCLAIPDHTPRQPADSFGAAAWMSYRSCCSPFRGGAEPWRAAFCAVQSGRPDLAMDRIGRS